MKCIMGCMHINSCSRKHWPYCMWYKWSFVSVHINKGMKLTPTMSQTHVIYCHYGKWPVHFFSAWQDTPLLRHKDVCLKKWIGLHREEQTIQKLSIFVWWRNSFSKNKEFFPQLCLYILRLIFGWLLRCSGELLRGFWVVVNKLLCGCWYVLQVAGVVARIFF